MSRARRTLSATAAGVAVVALATSASLASAKQASPNRSATSHASTSGHRAKASHKKSCHGKLTHLSVDGIGIQEDAIIPFGTAKGFFAQHCLSVTRTTVSSFPAAIANVLGGSVDVTMAPDISDVDFLAKGAPLRVIAASFGEPTVAQTKTPQYKRNQDLTGIFVTKGSKLKKVTQLQGKTVSVPALGAQIHIVTAWAIKKAGGDPTKVNWVQLDFLTAESELTSHKIVGAGLTTPFSVTGVNHGDRLLVGDDVAFFGAGEPNGTWTTSAARWAQKKQALTAFAEAVTETNRYANTHFAQFAPYAAKLTGVSLKTIKATSYDASFPDDNTKALQKTMQRVAANMKYAGSISSLPKLAGVVVH